MTKHKASRFYLHRPYSIRRTLQAVLVLTCLGSMIPARATDEGAVGTRITIGDEATGMGINADGTRLYVTNINNNSVTEIDIAKRNVLRTIIDKMPAHKPDGCPHNFCRGIGAVGVAIDPNGKYAYVTSMRTDGLAFVDLQSGKVESAVKVERFPQNVLLSPDGQRAYVMNLVSNSISVVNIVEGKTIGKPIALHGGDAHNMPFGRPVGLRLSADGKRLFVTNGVADSIDIFDTDSLTQVGTITPGGYTEDIAVDAKNGILFALQSDGIIEYDAQTLEPRAAMNFCQETAAHHLALAPDGNSVALSLSEASVAVTVDTHTGLVNGAYATGEWPLALRYMPDGETLVVLAHGTAGLFDTHDHSGAAIYLAKHGELFCKPREETPSP